MNILSQFSSEIIESFSNLLQIPTSVLIASNGIVNVSSFTERAFYIPSSNNESLTIGNKSFVSDGNVIRDAITNEIIICLKINNKLFKLLPGSIIGIEITLDELYQFNGLGLNAVLDANNNNSKWINNYG